MRRDPTSPTLPTPPTPPRPPNPPATLVVHVDRFSHAAASTGNVYVDGVRMVNQDGPNPYVVAPGRHMVSAEVNVAGRTYGQADLQVEVPSGGVLNVFYAAPASLTTAGRLAFQPVDNAGAASVRARQGCLVALLIFVVAVVVVIVVATIGASTPRGTGGALAPLGTTAVSSTSGWG